MRIRQNARGHADAVPCGLAFPPRPSHVTRGPPDQLGGSKDLFGELDRRPIDGRAPRSWR